MKKQYKAKTNLYVGYEHLLSPDIKDGWSEEEKTPLFIKGDIVEVDFDKVISVKYSEDYTEQRFYINEGFVNLSNSDGQERYDGYFSRVITDELEEYFEEVANE